MQMSSLGFKNGRFQGDIDTHFLATLGTKCSLTECPIECPIGGLGVLRLSVLRLSALMEEDWVSHKTECHNRGGLGVLRLSALMEEN